jgi:hypothetical protein
MPLDTDTTNTRETYRFLSERSWLRIYVLYIKYVPCAFLARQLYNNNVYCQYAGYHPDYTQFSVGSLLMARVRSVSLRRGPARGFGRRWPGI